jgi:hypothetical protein
VAAEHLEGLRGRRRVHLFGQRGGAECQGPPPGAAECAPPAGTASPPPGQVPDRHRPPGHRADRLRAPRAGSAVVRRSVRTVSAEAPRHSPCGASRRTRSSTAAW